MDIDFVVLIFVAVTNLSSEMRFSGSVASNTYCMLNLSSYTVSCITLAYSSMYYNIIPIVLHFPALVTEPRPLSAVSQETATDQVSGKFTA